MNAGSMDTAFSTREEPRLYRQVRANICVFKVSTCLYDRFYRRTFDNAASQLIKQSNHGSL